MAEGFSCVGRTEACYSGVTPDSLDDPELGSMTANWGLSPGNGSSGNLALARG